VTTTKTTRSIRIGLALVLVLAIAVFAGCAKKTAVTPATPKKSVDTRTAKGAAMVALSSMPTSVPNPKLLLCQTIMPTEVTRTPIWQFLVGSPKDSQSYNVIVNGGVAQSRVIGKIVMKPNEWAKVPSLKDWKIDSDVARTNALNVYPDGQNATYISSLLTYVSAAATNTISPPMTWVIDFNPASRHEKNASSTVLVDVRTGAAALVK
jgi:hypothetical protein